MLVMDEAQWCDDYIIQFFTYLHEREFFSQHGLLVLISDLETNNLLFERYIDRNIARQNLETIKSIPLITIINIKVGSADVDRENNYLLI